MLQDASFKPTPAQTKNGQRPVEGSAAEPPLTPDPEVLVRPQRRYHTVGYKIRTVEKVRALRKAGPDAVGAFLRAEGLYSSNVRTWDHLYESGELHATPRGPKQQDQQTLSEENKKLRRKIEQLEHRLAKTEMIVELQKKLSSMLELEAKNDNGQQDEQ